MNRKRPHLIYLNGAPKECIHSVELEKMSKRLERVVSLYFSQHPDEYENFLNNQKEKNKN